MLKKKTNNKYVINFGKYSSKYDEKKRVRGSDGSILNMVKKK